MAVELERFLADQLDRLSPHHPDRRFLEGLQETLAGYIEQTGAVPTRQAVPETTAPTLGADTPLPQPSAEREQERVTFAGRVGTAPAYRTTNKGRVIVRFSVAEPIPGEEKPVWHTVFAFDDRARRLREKGLAKGAAVTVVGYKHERQITGRDGKQRTVEDIYAVAVRTR